MRNTDILYQLSTDYERLYKLLHEGKILVGFVSHYFNNKIDNEYSQLTEMKYEKRYAKYDLGMIFFECDFNKEDFIKLCERDNIRFIDVAD